MKKQNNPSKSLAITEMSAEESLAGVTLKLREIAAISIEEERETISEEKVRRDRLRWASSAGTPATNAFHEWDAYSLKSVMNELDKLENLCDNLIKRSSSPGVSLPDNLQMSSLQKESERISSDDDRTNSAHSGRLVEFKGEGTSRSCKKSFDTPCLKVIGRNYESSGNCMKNDNFVISPNDEKRRGETSCSDRKFTRQTKVKYSTPLSTPGTKGERSSIRLSEPCGQKKSNTVVMSDDKRKAEAYWEQIARILNGSVISATTVLVEQSPAKPSLIRTDGGDCVDIPVADPNLATNKMHAGEHHEMREKHNTVREGHQLKRNNTVYGKIGPCGTSFLNAKKLGRLAAKSGLLKNCNSLKISKEKNKRKIPLSGLSNPSNERKLKSTIIIDEDSSADGKDESKKQEVFQTPGNMEDNVPYEQYVWKPDESITDGGRESSLASAWENMAFARAGAPTAESDFSQICEHLTIDWDEEVGWYCEDCGCMGQKMKLKGCLHENRLWKDEVGQYCEDCGLAGTDIQKIFIPGSKDPQLRKQTDLNRFKDNETAGGKDLQFNLQLPPWKDEDFSEATMRLDPVFEQKLHSHQKDGFKFLAKNLLGNKQEKSMGCILAHAPGTGKTCLMISFIQSFLTRFSEGRVLILAPKIMLKSWQNEFAQWKVDIPVYCLNGCTYNENAEAEYELQETLEHYAEIPAHVKKTLKENRARVLQEWRGGKGVLVMSYTLFVIMIDRGLDAKVALDALTTQMCRVVLDAPDLVVLDEGHLARTKQTKILKSLRQMRTRRRVILSGTLFHNNFKELYTLFKLCRDDFMKAHPFYSGMSKRSGPHNKLSALQQEENTFQNEIGEVLEKHVKDGTGADREVSQAVECLRLLTASFIHWYPGKILESLPGLKEYAVQLNLSDVQKRVISLLPRTKGNNNSLAIRNKVFSACIHPSLVMRHRTKNPYFGESASHGTEPLVTSEYEEAFQGVKIEFLIRLLKLCKQSHERMVIFCTTLGPLNYIQNMLLVRWGWKLGQQVLRLDGTMAEVDRQEVIRLFNLPQGSALDSGPRLQLLLASTKACKEGISLVGASRVVILDNHDNPSVLRQAVSRAFRIGQKKVVFVYRLLTNHKDEMDLFQRSVNKERLSKVLLDTFNQTTTMSQLEEFLRPLHSPSEVEDQMLQTLMLHDRRRIINAIHRYNASGMFTGQAAD